MQDKMVDNRTAGGVGVQTVPNLNAEPQKRKKKKAFLLKNATEKTGDPGPFLYL